MDFAKQSIEAFAKELAGASPVPGGGGASALAGAVGVALGNMVGSLTEGKKKYADVQDDILRLNARAATLRQQLLALIQKDAEAFEPLSRAYGLPTETEEQKQHKQAVMEAALQTAVEAPLAIMQACCDAIQLHAEYAAKGTAIAISDVGVGVALCKAALQGASLNVFINTKSMKDRTKADGINRQANDMLEKYTSMADDIYQDVAKRFEQ